jgi:hypothetical protein
VVWIIILLILLVAFGPLLWLMPTRRERRLAGLRQQAYKEGMRVEMRRLPKQKPAPEERVTAGGRPLDLTRECAAYLYPLPHRLRMLPRWRVLRGEDGIEAYPGWIFELHGKPDDPRLDEMLAAVEPVVRDLPEDVIAFECEPQNVAGYWLESPGTGPERVADLATRLGEAARSLTQLDRRLEEQAEGGDEHGNI